MVRTAVYVFYLYTRRPKKPLENKGSAEIEPATFHLREDRFSMLLSSTIIACPATSTTWTRAIGWAGSPRTAKTRCMVDLSLFNPELKFVTSITPSYELQIWWFFFLFSSKIMIFHLVQFVCMLISISCNLYIWLDFFHPSRETKNMFLHNN